MMNFNDIPLEVYGIIVNFMSNPIQFTTINKECYNFMYTSVYALCSHKEFVINDVTTLNNKYDFIKKLNVEDTNVTNIDIKRYSMIRHIYGGNKKIS